MNNRLAVGCVVFGSWWYFNHAAPYCYASESYGGDFREQAAQLLGSRLAPTIYVYPATGVTGTLESIGPDVRGCEKIELQRVEPFRCITMCFELCRNDRSATFTGEDMEAVRFLDFKLAATPLEK